MSVLSKRIKRMMSKRQMTVQMLLMRCNIGKTYLYDILADRVDLKTVTIGKLEEIAKGLDVRVVELLLDPDLKGIEAIRQLLTEEDIEIVNKFESLDEDDWKRKAIIEMLNIDIHKEPPQDSIEEGSVND